MSGDDDPPFRWVSFLMGLILGFTIGIAFAAIVSWVTLVWLTDHQPKKVPTRPVVDVVVQRGWLNSDQTVR